MQIETLELSTRDLSAIESFYGDQLGLATAQDDDRNAITAGKTKLIFRQDQSLEGAYHFAFNIPENRLKPAITWLQSLGIDLIPNGDDPVHDFQDWNAHAVYFLDPAGNILELIARHELGNAVETDEPFSAKELLNVSEIGVACEDVLQTANQMTTDFGLEPYRNPNDPFAPIGDANGLFILVPVGRTWYPNTGIPAKNLPMKVTFSESTNSFKPRILCLDSQ